MESNETDSRVLAELGLTQGEIKAYLALLELGSSSTGPIAEASQVSRSKLYGILDKLEKKGLASHVEKNGIIYFQAAEPSKVKDYLMEKKAELERLEKEFQEFLPNLKALQKQAGRVQKVVVYQGLKGLMTAHEHTYLKLKRGEEYCGFGVPKFQPEPHHRYWKRDHERRVKAGIKCKLLFNQDTDNEILANRNSYRGCDARHMPTDIKTPAYFMIYTDTVMIAVPSDNPIVVEITSQEIADAFKAYFGEFWRMTVPFK